MLAYALSVQVGQAVVWIAGAGVAAYALLVLIRKVEDRLLDLSEELIQDRGMCPLGPLCIPASAFAAILCCIHAIFRMWTSYVT